jgi:hypothetical protein
MLPSFIENLKSTTIYLGKSKSTLILVMTFAGSKN